MAGEIDLQAAVRFGPVVAPAFPALVNTLTVSAKAEQMATSSGLRRSARLTARRTTIRTCSLPVKGHTPLPACAPSVSGSADKLRSINFSMFHSTL
jgi:hypothetical protein